MRDLWLFVRSAFWTLAFPEPSHAEARRIAEARRNAVTPTQQNLFC